MLRKGNCLIGDFWKYFNKLVPKCPKVYPNISKNIHSTNGPGHIATAFNSHFVNIADQYLNSPNDSECTFENLHLFINNRLAESEKVSLSPIIEQCGLA